MRILTRITLAALLALLLACAASGQSASGAWVKVAPDGESFSVRMPAQPVSRAVQAAARDLKVEGRQYFATGEGKSIYVVWSLDDPNNVGQQLSAVNYVSALFHGEALYLDQIAEVGWQLIVEPELERIKREKIEARNVGMFYRREFELGGRPAREYSAQFESVGGPVYVCADGPRIYIVAAFGSEAQDAQLKQFVESFSFNVASPSVVRTETKGAGDGAGIGPGRGINVGDGGGMGSGSGVGGSGVNNRGAGGSPPASVGGEVDYTRTFSQKEVTRKALIRYKPEPRFTEDARKFNVSGVVRIRGILSSAGEVTGLYVVKGLPHGLTAMALDAARQIKFEPAQKDGHAVSQFVTFEYNFNIY